MTPAPGVSDNGRPSLRKGSRKDRTASIADEATPTSKPPCQPPRKSPKIIHIPDDDDDDKRSRDDARVQRAISSLRGDNWLNDDAIRDLLALLEYDRTWIHDAHQPKRTKTSHSRTPSPNVRQVVFGLVHGGHWTLIIADLKRAIVTLYDSMPTSKAHERTVRAMVEGWLPGPETPSYRRDSLFEQADAYNCSVFTCLHALYAILKLPRPSTPPDPCLWRLLFADILKRLSGPPCSDNRSLLAPLAPPHFKDAEALLSQLREAQRVFDALYARLSAIVHDIERQRQEWKDELLSAAAHQLDEENASMSLSCRERRNREIEGLLKDVSDFTVYQGRRHTVQTVRQMVDEESCRLQLLIRRMAGRAMGAPFDEMACFMDSIRAGKSVAPDEIGKFGRALSNLEATWKSYTAVLGIEPAGP